MHDSVQSVLKHRLAIGHIGASSTSCRLCRSNIDNFAALATGRAVSSILGKPIASNSSDGLCVRCFDYLNLGFLYSSLILRRDFPVDEAWYVSYPKLNRRFDHLGNR